MARPIWKGAINFGLVNIPVELVTAVHEKAVNFHLLSKDGKCRLRRKLYCPETGEEFEYNETARGVEIAPDEYALVENKEIDRLRPQKGRSLEIEQFIDPEVLDPVYYDRVYYLLPSGDTTKAYKLLVEAMKHGRKSAIARFVMRQKQYITVLRASGDGLIMHTLHYADEVSGLQDMLPSGLEKAKVNDSELKIATDLIKAMSKPLKIETFRDEYREQLEKLVEAKVKGKQLVKPADDHDDEPVPRTINLMEALKKSLQANKPKDTGHTRRRKSA